MDASWIVSFLSEASQKEVLHYGFFFTVAALVHAKQVRKEIAIQFTALTTSINLLSDSMSKHSARLDTVEGDVKVIKNQLGLAPKEK